jgi:hypothetical protein
MLAKELDRKDEDAVHQASAGHRARPWPPHLQAPKHQMKVTDLGMALGKWNGTRAQMNTKQEIKEAFDFKNSIHVPAYYLSHYLSHYSRPCLLFVTLFVFKGLQG